MTKKSDAQGTALAPLAAGYWRLPNDWWTTTAELRPVEREVLAYVIRHSWGFGRTHVRLTAREVAEGRRALNGKMDEGVGCSLNTAKAALHLLVERGHLALYQPEPRSWMYFPRRKGDPAGRFAGLMPPKVRKGRSRI